MSTEITEATIRKLEALARLCLSDAARDRLTQDLARIVEYIEQLDTIDVEGVPPTTHVGPGTEMLREDVVRASLPVEDVLRNAPDRTGAFYRVPRFVGEEGAP